MKHEIPQTALLAAALAAGLALCTAPAGAQVAKRAKQDAVSGQQSTGGSVPLRVGLVISDATRSYKTMIMLTRVEFGRRLGDKAVRIFNETFASVQQMTALPVAPSGYGGLDLVVVVEVVDGHTQTPFLSQTSFFLTARFTVFNSSGQQILQLQEGATDKSGSPAAGPDAVGEMVVRRFIQELILNPSIRNLLAPSSTPAVAVEQKPVGDDSAALASAGLDVPPPPPWGVASGAVAAVTPARPRPETRP